MSKTGMLGNQEVLRKLWCGPLQDLMSKLNGPEGSMWLASFKRFLRMEPVWDTFPLGRVNVALDGGEMVKVVTVSVERLGFSNGGSRVDVYLRALSSGLSLCCDGSVNALTPCPRELCGDRPIIIAEEPIRSQGGKISLAVVSRSGTTFLTVPATEDFFFNSTDMLAFMER